MALINFEFCYHGNYWGDCPNPLCQNTSEMLKKIEEKRKMNWREDKRISEMLDNAACACQDKLILDDDVTREAIYLNCIKPLLFTEDENRELVTRLADHIRQEIIAGRMERIKL